MHLSYFTLNLDYFLSINKITCIDDGSNKVVYRYK